MFPLNSNDQYVDTNGKRHLLSELFEGSEHDIEELEETVAGHTTKIGTLETLTGTLQDQINPDEYSEDDAYTVGDYVIHGNKLYKCNTSCTADSWENNSQYFTETSVVDEIVGIKSDLSNIGIAYSLDNATDVNLPAATNVEALQQQVPAGIYIVNIFGRNDYFQNGLRTFVGINEQADIIARVDANSPGFSLGKLIIMLNEGNITGNIFCESAGSVIAHGVRMTIVRLK